MMLNRLKNKMPTPRAFLMAAALIVGGSVNAAPIDIDTAGLLNRIFQQDEEPLFFGVAPSPNIVILMDDSLSMSSNILMPLLDGGLLDGYGDAPGIVDGSRDDAQGRGRAAGNASLYYDSLAPIDPTLATLRDDMMAEGIIEPGFGLMAPSWELVQAWKAASSTGRARICPLCDTSLEIDESGDALWKLNSSRYNEIYYDPSKVYEPWPGVDANGDAYTDADPDNALFDPYLGGETIDLTDDYSYQAKVRFANGDEQLISHDEIRFLFIVIADYGVKPAHYYTQDVNGNPVYNEITDNDELDNFANWFQYYRSRAHIAKGALASVIASLQGGRVGFSTISNDQDFREPVTVLDGDETTGALKAMLDKVYSVKPFVQGSSIRNALWHVGEYFSCDATSKRYDTYYAEDSSASSSTENMFGDNSCPMLDEADGGTCQANYALILTDGFDTPTASEFDHTGYPQNDGFALGDDVLTYNDPFEADTLNADIYDVNSGFDGGAYGDAFSDTLADVAMDYFERDINSALEQDQRMKTHVITLGADTTLSTPTDPTVAHGWTNPVGPLTLGALEESTSYFHVHSQDDLVHAAFNGRGDFINALNSNLVGQLASSLAASSDFDISGGNISTNSAVLDGNTVIYTTSYNTGDLSGDVMPLVINTDGTLGDNAWALSAAQQLQDDTDRVILTYDFAGTTGQLGMEFSYANLQDVNLLGGLPIPNTPLDTITDGIFDSVGAVLAPILGGLSGLTLLEPLGITTGLSENQVNYIRGVRSEEADQGGSLRTRGASVLGPIFHSEPVVVGSPKFDYPDDPSAPENNYSTFRTAHANRTEMVYVSANDGMLHGFRASDGKELLAYVPGEILPKLNAFTNPAYLTDPVALVDGRITIVDAFDSFPACGNSECWRTILIGALRGGGQAIFALDITEPTDFSVANADDIVLWEFNDQAPLLSSETIEGLLIPLICNETITVLGVAGPICDPDDAGNIVTSIVADLVSDILDELPSETRGHSAMGYIYGQPNAGKLADGSWGVVLGNGINSNEVDISLPNTQDNLLAYSPLGMNFTGDAYTFVIDLATGILKEDLTTGVGQFADLRDILVLDPVVLVSGLLDTVSAVLLGVTGSMANGIVAPATVDVNGDGVIDYIYILDLLGNLNRIDVDDASIANWGFSNDDGSSLTAVPALFSATDSSTKWQPVSTEPMVMRHPNYDPSSGVDEGFLVLFGTGAYFESEDDPSSYQNQSFYAIWDKDGSTVVGTPSLGATPGNRNDLYQRFIDREITQSIDTNGDGNAEVVSFRTTTDATTFEGEVGADSGVLDWSTKNGWYIDLVVADSATALETAENYGERVIVDPILRNGKILFNTLIPGDNTCTANDSSIAYQLDAADGSPTYLPAFDLNGDGYLSQADKATIGEDLVDVSGRVSTSGQNAQPVVIIKDGQEVHININQEGGVEITNSNPIGYEHSRSTWREIR
jgi:Tfp pilus tip-associated adhesin PilY1